MKFGTNGAAIRQIGHLFEGGSVAGLGEVQLLERFVERRDSSAFSAIVARHGPMVLGVCRRVLDDPHDVEDAFQATFLVLVRRAGSIRDRERLASWLFGVARKVANRARLDRSRRMAREAPGAETLAATPEFDGHRAELGRALVEEIGRLPDSLRLPVILCCVDGLAYGEAADRLGSTEPAIRGRLFRARERLRLRLARRGFAPASAALGALFSAEKASAAVPATWVASTTRLAIGYAAGRAATAGAVPAAVAGLAEGVIRTMIFTKSKIAATALIACGIAGSSMGVLGQQPAPTPVPAPSVAPTPQPRLDEPSQSDRFDALERRLDRLIRALEGPASRTAAPIPPPGQASADITLPSPSGLTPSAGAAPDAFAPGSGTGTFAGPDGIVTTVQTPGVARKGTDVRSSSRNSATSLPRNASTRLDAVEQKLERLEARLADLERKLSSDAPPPPEPAGSRLLDPTRGLTSPDARPAPGPRPLNRRGVPNSGERGVPDDEARDLAPRVGAPAGIPR